MIENVGPGETINKRRRRKDKAEDRQRAREELEKLDSL